MITFVF